MEIKAGLWGRDMSKSSSNHRVFWNLVESEEYALRDGQLINVELSLFCDRYVT